MGSWCCCPISSYFSRFPSFKNSRLPHFLASPTSRTPPAHAFSRIPIPLFHEYYARVLTSCNTTPYAICIRIFQVITAVWYQWNFGWCWLAEKEDISVWNPLFSQWFSMIEMRQTSPHERESKFRNPRNFSLWDLKSEKILLVESGIQLRNPESH